MRQLQASATTIYFENPHSHLNFQVFTSFSSQLYLKLKRIILNEHKYI